MAGFAVRRLIPFAIWVGIGYHTALFVTTGHTFGMFWYATACSYLAFVRWPTRLDVVFDARSAFWRAVHAIGRRVDFENRFTWTPGDATVVTGEGRETRGTLACLFRCASCEPGLVHGICVRGGGSGAGSSPHRASSSSSFSAPMRLAF